MNTPKSDKQLQEEFRKFRIAEHAIWLENPTTVLAIQKLSKYRQDIREKFIGLFLADSQVERDIRYRNTLTTLDAVNKILTDPDTFVEQPNTNTNVNT